MNIIHIFKNLLFNNKLLFIILFFTFKAEKFFSSHIKLDEKKTCVSPKVNKKRALRVYKNVIYLYMFKIFNYKQIK